MNITKEMALKSIRPDVDSYGRLGVPTEADIQAELLRLTKDGSLTEKKILRRRAHPADVNDLAELVEEVTNRLLVLERKVK